MTNSVDTKVRKTSIHTTDEARLRLKKRYQSETGFKWIGRAAIGVSVGFLLLLLTSVVGQGLPAFTFNFVNLPFEITAEKLGTDGSDPVALKKADYDSVVRDAIRGQFPFVKSRKDKKLLGGLLSSGSSVYLRQQVLNKPSVIGTDAKLEVPISDFGDLYLKGQISSSSFVENTSRLAIADNDGDVLLTAEGDVFLDALASAKVALGVQVERVRRDLTGAGLSIEKTNNDIISLNEKIPAATDEEIKGRLENNLLKAEKNLKVLNARVKQFAAKIADFDSRIADTRMGEELTDVMPSQLVYVGDAVFKLISVTPNSATAETIKPFGEDVLTTSNDWTIRTLDIVESSRKFSDKEIVWTDALVEREYVRNGFNTIFFSRGASREPEMAGVLGAVIGSALTLIITLALSFPLGVAAAIYLEEFAPKNRWTTIIEVNINNLAAVPSIVFGLLGLAVFLNFFELDRSAPYVGGMVLALMTLPTIIIASRAALRAVPPSIREAALGIGASRLQTVVHHVLPLAMPGILTGTIIGMAQALGETAPLLMIGMVAFVVDIPTAFSDPATVLPVQIFMWADFPEPAFQQRTSAAIMVLLGFLIAMNAFAVVLRKRFERRW